MTHRSTAIADLRRADRERQRRKRERMKTEGIPAPRQIDNAVSEAMSFALTVEHEKRGSLKDVDDVQLSYKSVFQTALRILVIRMRFNPEYAAKALKARLDERPEHRYSYWEPHLKSCEPKFWLDVSSDFPHDVPVTTSGHVTHRLR